MVRGCLLQCLTVLASIRCCFLLILVKNGSHVGDRDPLPGTHLPLDQPCFFQVSVQGLSFRGPIPALTTPLQVLVQPLLDVVIDPAEGVSRVTLAEVARPTAQVAVEVCD